MSNPSTSSPLQALPSLLLSLSFRLLSFSSRLLLYPFRLFYNADHASWKPASPEAQQLRVIFRAQLSRPCHIRLDTASSAQMTLPDKRELGYAQYGDLHSLKTIIKLHGLPGSRLEEAWHDEIAQRLGVRIIGVDRPGVGLSSPNPHASLRSFAYDIEALADHLHLRHFAVVGTSGGGPYVMACARYLPAEKLMAVGNVCGMGDLQRFSSSRGMGWTNWLGYKYAIHWIPWIFPYQASHWPVNRADLLSEEAKLHIWIEEITSSDLAQRDVEAWGEVGGVDFLRLSLRAQREYFIRGYETLLQDAKLLGSKWEFQVEDIRPDLPLHLWFGREDKNVSGYHGVEIAKRFRGEAKLHYLDETHLSLQVKYQERILEEITKEL